MRGERGSTQNDSANKSKEISYTNGEKSKNNSLTKLLEGERQAKTRSSPARRASDGKVKKKSEFENICTKNSRKILI